MSRLVLELHGVTVAHAHRAPVMNDVSLRLSPGFTGVVGANGAGKSTLLRVLAGELSPASGTVRREPHDALVAMVSQDALACGEDVLAFAKDDDGRAAELRGRLALDEEPSPDRWGTMSPGERQRWRVGAALVRDPDVLLLDEPTNHLDREAREKLVSALRRFRGIGVVVSHDRALLETLATRTVRVHAGQVVTYTGAYGAAMEQWSLERRAAEAAHGAARARERLLLARLDEARREHASADRARSTRTRMKGPRDSDARGSLAKGQAAMAEARTGRTAAVVRAAYERAAQGVPEIERDRTIGGAVFAGYERAPRPVLFHLDAPIVASRHDPAVTVLRDVRFTIGRDERVRVAGPNGAGKSTLLGAILASGPPRSHLLVLGQELSASDVAEEIELLRSATPEARGRALSIFASLGSDPEAVLPRVASRIPAEDVAATLSPGEARKLVLGSGLGRHAWALVLDEPENHLDLPTLERLEAALVLYPGALVLVTHDDALAARLTTRTVDVHAGRVR